MPKVILSEAQRDQEAIEKLIKKYAGAENLTLPKVAKLVGMPATTFYKRINHPETSSLGELRRICRVLKIPEEERRVIL